MRFLLPISSQACGTQFVREAGFFASPGPNLQSSNPLWVRSLGL